MHAYDSGVVKLKESSPVSWGAEGTWRIQFEAIDEHFIRFRSFTSWLELDDSPLLEAGFTLQWSGLPTGHVLAYALRSGEVWLYDFTAGAWIDRVDDWTNCTGLLDGEYTELHPAEYYFATVVLFTPTDFPDGATAFSNPFILYSPSSGYSIYHEPFFLGDIYAPPREFDISGEYQASVGLSCVAWARIKQEVGDYGEWIYYNSVDGMGATEGFIGMFAYTSGWRYNDVQIVTFDPPIEFELDIEDIRVSARQTGFSLELPLGGLATTAAGATSDTPFESVEVLGTARAVFCGLHPWLEFGVTETYISDDYETRASIDTDGVMTVSANTDILVGMPYAVTFNSIIWPFRYRYKGYAKHGETTNIAGVYVEDLFENVWPISENSPVYNCPGRYFGEVLGTQYIGGVQEVNRVFALKAVNPDDGNLPRNYKRVQLLLRKRSPFPEVSDVSWSFPNRFLFDDFSEGWSAHNCTIQRIDGYLQVTPTGSGAYIEKTFTPDSPTPEELRYWCGHRWAELVATPVEGIKLEFVRSSSLVLDQVAPGVFDTTAGRSGVTDTEESYIDQALPAAGHLDIYGQYISDESPDLSWSWGVGLIKKLRVHVPTTTKLYGLYGRTREEHNIRLSWRHGFAQTFYAGTYIGNVDHERYLHRLGALFVDGRIATEVPAYLYYSTPNAEVWDLYTVAEAVHEREVPPSVWEWTLAEYDPSWEVSGHMWSYLEQVLYCPFTAPAWFLHVNKFVEGSPLEVMPRVDRLYFESPVISAESGVLTLYYEYLGQPQVTGELLEGGLAPLDAGKDYYSYQWRRAESTAWTDDITDKLGIPLTPPLWNTGELRFWEHVAGGLNIRPGVMRRVAIQDKGALAGGIGLAGSRFSATVYLSTADSLKRYNAVGLGFRSASARDNVDDTALAQLNGVLYEVCRKDRTLYLHLTTDGGRTWSVPQTIATEVLFMDIAFSMTAASGVIAYLTANGVAAQRVTLAGAPQGSAVQVVSGSFSDVAITTNPHNDFFVLAVQQPDGTLLRYTSPDGLDWQEV